VFGPWGSKCFPTDLPSPAERRPGKHRNEIAGDFLYAKRTLPASRARVGAAMIRFFEEQVERSWESNGQDIHQYTDYDDVFRFSEGTGLTSRRVTLR
jgi:hypothetical protein